MRAFRLEDPKRLSEVSNDPVESLDRRATYVSVAREDEAQSRTLLDTVQVAVRNDPSSLHVLVPYAAPPAFACREDGDVRAFASIGAVLQDVVSAGRPLSVVTPYRAVIAALTAPRPPPIAVSQFDRDGRPSEGPSDRWPRVSVLVPHLGDGELLRRCVESVQRQLDPARDEILVGLDYIGDVSDLSRRVKGWGCRVFNVLAETAGPYAIRNYLAMAAGNPVLIFQDSDDVPLRGRFGALATRIAQGGEDVVGSHEMRLDVISERLIAVRFPLDVNAALGQGPYHALLHPTSAVSAGAFASLGGLSDYAMHSLDTEFLLRAHLLGARLANVDEFLYLRMSRPRSLTTSTGTGYDSYARRRLWTKWYRDFDAIQAGCMHFEASSLVLRRSGVAKLAEVYQQSDDEC